MITSPTARPIHGILLVVLVAWGCTAVPRKASLSGKVQEKPSPQLDFRLGHFQFKDVSLPYVWLTQIGRLAGTSGWIFYEESAVQYKHHNVFSLDLTSMTVRDSLDALVAADTSYYWIADGDVINLIPKVRSAQGPDVVATLERKLPRFEIAELYLGEALGQLIDQARAQGIAELTGPRFDPLRENETDGYVPEGNYKITLSFENRSIRECLNAIVAGDAPSSWMAEPDQGKVMLLVFPLHSYSFKGGRGKHKPTEFDRIMLELNRLVNRQAEQDLAKDEEVELGRLQQRAMELEEQMLEEQKRRDEGGHIEGLSYPPGQVE